MAIHYHTSRQMQRVGRAVNQGESFGQRSEFKQQNLQAQNALIVTVQEDIEAKTKGDAKVMRGLISSLNESSDPEITVWNLSEVNVQLGEIVLVVWTLSENSSGSWVIIVPSFTTPGDETGDSGGTGCNGCIGSRLPGRVLIQFQNFAEPVPIPFFNWVSGIAVQINGFHTLTRLNDAPDTLCIRQARIELTNADPFKFLEITLYVSSSSNFFTQWYLETLLLDENLKGSFLEFQQHGVVWFSGTAFVFGKLDCEAKETILIDQGQLINQWDTTSAILIVNPRSGVPIGGPTQVENITPIDGAFTADAFTIAWDDDNGTSWDVYLTEEGDALTSVSVGQGSKTFSASGLTAGALHSIGIVGSDGTDQSQRFSSFTVINNMYGTIEVGSNSTVTTISSSSSDFSNKVQVTVFDTNGADSDVTADHTNDHLLINTAGAYQCEARVSVSGTAGDTISFALFKNNGATQLGVRSTQELDAEEVVAVSSGPIVLSATDTVELWVQNEDSTNDVTIQDGMVTVFRVGN